MDESGDMGSSQGSSDYFLLTVLEVEKQKSLSNLMRREKTRLYNMGWPRKYEIKGSHLNSSIHKPFIPFQISQNRFSIIGNLIEKILKTGAVPHYLIVKKDQMPPQYCEFSYEKLYSLFSMLLLKQIYEPASDKVINLVVDERCREARIQNLFDTEIVKALTFDCKHSGGVEITHAPSNSLGALQAVDILSWSIFRAYEHQDAQFYDLIKPYLGVNQQAFA